MSLLIYHLTSLANKHSYEKPEKKKNLKWNVTLQLTNEDLQAQGDYSNWPVEGILIIGMDVGCHNNI